jgi:hypothetical protein
MSGRKDQKNPIAFIAIGVCFMGAGVALNAALHSEGASAVGIGIIGIGVMFLLLGVARLRRI